MGFFDFFKEQNAKKLQNNKDDKGNLGQLLSIGSIARFPIFLFGIFCLLALLYPQRSPDLSLFGDIFVRLVLLPGAGFFIWFGLPKKLQISLSKKIRLAIEDVQQASKKSYIGGLGEHYCSQDCYDRGGATVTKHLIENWTGDCSVCRGPVSLRVGGPASMVCWKPGTFLFHCGSQSCVRRVAEHVQASKICAICGKPI